MEWTEIAPLLNSCFLAFRVSYLFPQSPPILNQRTQLPFSNTPHMYPPIINPIPGSRLLVLLVPSNAICSLSLCPMENEESKITRYSRNYWIQNVGVGGSRDCL